MPQDNSGASSESTGALDTVQAGEFFANLFDTEQVKEEKPDADVQADAKETPPVVPDKPADTEPREDAQAEDAPKVTIEIDGKTVELTQAQIAEAYKNGLRQEDYTRKTMEAADKRKAAEAETTKAREERQQYQQGLQQAQMLLQAGLQEQSHIDWPALLETDPVEYLKQQHLSNDRQAKLQRIGYEQQQLHAKSQAEQAEQMKAYMRTQQDELLAKLPEWKDESKAKTEKTAIRDYLIKQGFADDALASIDDHKAVLMARKAMLYDQMIDKASAAAKKVANLPQRVERPGGGENANLDKRTSDYQRLRKSGSIDDAARAMSHFL